MAMSVKSERDRLRRAIEDPGASLPVSTFGEAAPWLRRPFTPEAVRFKVVEAWADTEDGRPSKDQGLSRATIAPYIDARAVIARLNLVCPALWSEEFAPQSGRDGPLMWCAITMLVGEQGEGLPLYVTRRDVGSTYDGKGLVSDALKRAAVKFGVGESLYAVPPIELTTARSLSGIGGGSEPTGYLMPWRIDGDAWLKLTRAGEEHCRDIYRRWLLARGGGIDSFGKPLDHGNLTMLGESEGEGPPLPVLRPGEKRETPAKRGRQAPQPSVPKVTPAPVEPVDPEEAAAAEVASLLAVTDGLAGLRDTLNRVMIASGVELASERLRVMRDAGDERGLKAALKRYMLSAKAEQEPIEQEGDTTT